MGALDPPCTGAPNSARASARSRMDGRGHCVHWNRRSNAGSVPPIIVSRGIYSARSDSLRFLASLYCGGPDPTVLFFHRRGPTASFWFTVRNSERRADLFLHLRAGDRRFHEVARARPLETILNSGAALRAPSPQRCVASQRNSFTESGSSPGSLERAIDFRFCCRILLLAWRHASPQMAFNRLRGNCRSIFHLSLSRHSEHQQDRRAG